MKKLLFLASLVGVVVLAGCGAKTPAVTTTVDTGSAQVTTQLFETSGFTIQYPATRSVQENVYGARVMFFSPLGGSGDQFKENVGVVSEILPTDMKVADYYATIKTQITNMIKDYQELSNEDITINGVAAKKIVYVGTQSNYKLKRMQVLMIKNKTAYIINYTASADTFDEFATQANDIATSFMAK